MSSRRPPAIAPFSRIWWRGIWLVSALFTVIVAIVAGIVNGAMLHLPYLAAAVIAFTWVQAVVRSFTAELEERVRRARMRPFEPPDDDQD